MSNENNRFVLELPLMVDAKQEKILLSRLETARQVYNACLGEALKRLKLLRESRDYRKACKMPKGQERNKAFRQAKRAIGFSNYDLQSYTKQFNHCWLREHLDSQVNKALATRAFRATEQYMYGNRGRPHFKHYGNIRSVSGINNLQSIRWRDGWVKWNSSSRKKLELKAVIDESDPLVQHGLECPVKFNRIVRKVIHGRNHFYAQLVLVGKPYQRYELGEGVVGLDIGPSTVAIVSESGVVMLERFCNELEDRHKKIRRLQRKTDRQRRENNPDNYREDGTVIKGAYPWHKSERMKKTEAELQELHRVQGQHRKTLHGELVNTIFQLGDVIKMEKLSYKAWQRNKHFAKSVQFRAPGAFVERLHKRADALGAKVIEFGTYKTKFSRIDHITAEEHPEWADLSVRYKELADGTYVQRDQYSAFLAMCYDVESGSLDADLARERWSGEGSRQQMAFRELLKKTRDE